MQLCSLHTVCCTHLLFLLITSLWTLAAEAVFTDAYSICCVMLGCTAGILNCLHHEWRESMAGSCRRPSFRAAQALLLQSLRNLFPNAFRYDHPSRGCGRPWGSLVEWLRFPLVSILSPGDAVGGCTETECPAALPSMCGQSMPTLLPAPCPALPPGLGTLCKGI